MLAARPAHPEGMVVLWWWWVGVLGYGSLFHLALAVARQLTVVVLVWERGLAYGHVGDAPRALAAQENKTVERCGCVCVRGWCDVVLVYTKQARVVSLGAACLSSF